MRIFFSYATLIALAALAACGKKNDYPSSEHGDLVKEWFIPMSSENVNHITSIGSPATGTLRLKLYSDSSLAFDVNIDNYQDNMTGATLNEGTPIDDDNRILVNLKPRVTHGYVNSVVSGLGGSIYTRLLNGDPNLYINIPSVHNPTGLVRGQINTNLVLSVRVPLSPVAGVTTPTTGMAYLRLTEEKKFYYKVDIANDESGVNAVNEVSIYKGTSMQAPTNEFLRLAGFNTAKTLSLTTGDYEMFLSSPLFLLVSSQANNPASGGKLRGQIR